MPMGETVYHDTSVFSQLFKKELITFRGSFEQPFFRDNRFVNIQFS